MAFHCLPMNLGQDSPIASQTKANHCQFSFFLSISPSFDFFLFLFLLHLHIQSVLRLAWCIYYPCSDGSFINSSRLQGHFHLTHSVFLISCNYFQIMSSMFIKELTYFSLSMDSPSLLAQTVASCTSQKRFLFTSD